MKLAIVVLVIAGAIAGIVAYTLHRDPAVAGTTPARDDTPATRISRAGIAAPLSGFAAVETGFRVAYAATSDPEREKVRELFVRDQVFDRIARSLNELVVMPRTVDIQMVDCGAPNAFYDPSNHRIIICYELITYFVDTFRPHAPTKQELGAAVMGATVFAFFHELGHALIGELGLPATGREEDAADQIATLILLDGGDDGVDMALAGARWFGLLASDNATRTPFWDEHALDGQRFFNVICLVYGKKPDSRANLVGTSLPEARAKRCPGEYRAIEAAWDKLIKPHLRAGRPVATPAAAPDGGPTCTDVSAHAVTVLRTEMAPGLEEELSKIDPGERDAAKATVEDRLANFASALTERCTSQGWNAKIRACLVAATSTDAAGGCLSQ